MGHLKLLVAPPLLGGSGSDFQEFEHNRIPFIRVADVAPVRSVLDNMKDTFGYRFVSAGTGTFERYRDISISVNDQCRYGDHRQIFAEICGSERLHTCQGGLLVRLTTHSECGLPLRFGNPGRR